MNELLCVLVNNFGSLPRATLVHVLSEFYTDDEIGEAKKVLLEQADGMSSRSDELKKVKPRQGDGKRV